MQADRARVRWHRPPARVEDAGPTEVGDLGQLVRRVGVPVSDEAKTAVELAVVLLRLAAEVEHALLVQYLYAAVSVPDEPAPNDVAYREKILHVAVQEMGHLATVQNLLLLLGGPEALHLQRDVLRLTSPERPIPFVLTPVTEVSVATYVTAEMPAQVPPELADRVDALVALAEQAAGDDLHRVGVLYELLQWMLRAPDEPDPGLDFAALAPLPDPPRITDADLRPMAELADHEAQRFEWQVFAEDIILPTVHTRAEAIAALAAIAQQGEGLASAERSHFEEFLELDTALRSGQVTVRPMPIDPTLPRPGEAGGTVIEHPYTQLWADVFDLHYQLLILSILHALRTSRADDAGSELRSGLAGLAMLEMRKVIVELSDLLAALPLRPGAGGGVAGPPYTLDPAVLTAPDAAALESRHLRLLDRLSELYRDIEVAPEFAAEPTHANMLINLRKVDRRRRDLLAPTVVH